MHGVLFDLWNKRTSSEKTSVLKFNEVFNELADVSSVSPSFTINAFSGMMNYSVREKGYVMVGIL
jgi:hypothetical protein